MADFIINEVLYFADCHFGKVPNDSIITVISILYNKDEHVEAKAVIYNVCLNSSLKIVFPALSLAKEITKVIRMLKIS